MLTIRKLAAFGSSDGSNAHGRTSPVNDDDDVHHEGHQGPQEHKHHAIYGPE